MTWRVETQQFGVFPEDVWILSRNGRDVARVAYWDGWFRASVEKEGKATRRNGFKPGRRWRHLPGRFDTAGGAMREAEEALA